ncbi:MAG: NUDIX domain-containing protein [Actinomycetota bacterium]
MPKLSAGLLAYRRTDAGLEVLLVHPGGPFWAKKDDGAWSLPKGEYEPGEDPLEVARREFEEEIGQAPPDESEHVSLGELRQPSGKVVSAWTMEGDLDVSDVHSNMFEMEWPPRSGRTQEFPEVDRAGWFGLEEARRKILRGQLGFLDRLGQLLGS